MRRLKFIRMERRLSQAKVARMADMSQPTLSRIECGRYNPTDRESDALSRVFGHSPQFLLEEVRDGQ
jgi:transcriptional regulator with XRE-family HTH domain